ncbi:alpha/beta hydrolase [Kitasatospora sp. NPDC094019]|uniref:alpha/beta hydrolase n=1 Tax=Kitasatospora sp. NPDC094019 TaxID=3364091 RepID=UPI00381EA7BA
MITRLSRRALPAVAAAVLLAACGGTGGSTGAASTAPTTAPTTSADPTAPAAVPTPTPTPTPTVKPTGQADPALGSFYGQQLAWAACKDDPKTAKTDESAVQCATLKVPLDYANPSSGETLDIGVARITGSKPGERTGSLLVNPGGPGGSGVSMVQGGQKDYDGPLRDHYDIVGFDPRGTGLSAPVNCLDDRARDTWATTDALGPEHGKLLADACRAKYGTLLEHLGTRDTARDMDVLRAALGDRKLTYLGLSYGTYLGSVYAEEFPDRVGRLVLDGAVDPAKPIAQSNIEQYAGFERSLQAFAAHCAKQAQCPLGKDPDQAAGKLADFLDGLKQKPLTTTGGRVLTSAAAWTGVVEGLYGDESGWDSLANAIGWAMVRGKGDNLLAYADSYNKRDKDGHYNVSADAYTAIYCADGATDVLTGAALDAAYAEMAAKAPLISRHEPGAALFDPDCRSWPFRSPEKAHPIVSKATTPIVVVGSTGDAATPYANSEKLATQLGNAVLLTREGEGHTGYGHSACIRDAVHAYLVDGTVPAAGTRCATDAAR